MKAIRIIEYVLGVIGLLMLVGAAVPRAYARRFLANASHALPVWIDPRNLRRVTWPVFLSCPGLPVGAGLFGFSEQGRKL